MKSPTSALAFTLLASTAALQAAALPDPTSSTFVAPGPMEESLTSTAVHSTSTFVAPGPMQQSITTTLTGTASDITIISGESPATSSRAMSSSSTAARTTVSSSSGASGMTTSTGSSGTASTQAAGASSTANAAATVGYQYLLAGLGLGAAIL